jgi:hypothetical protein
VGSFTVQDLPDAAGIYTGKWSHKNDPGRSKFSSMFPDNCSIEQVLNSISHASANPERNCPEGSPRWVKCGKNRPAFDTKELFFLIGFAEHKDNKINTAFPLRQ